MTSRWRSRPPRVGHRLAVSGHAGCFNSVLGEALARGLTVRFRAEGDSMHPTIRNGDLITVTPVGADEIARGDVLLYRQGHRVLAHRLVDVTCEDGMRLLHLRGDAKQGRDRPVAARDVVGRVISVARRNREIAWRGRAARLSRAMRVHASRAAALFCYHPAALSQ